MPTYGESKKKDMIRSVLPSKAARMTRVLKKRAKSSWRREGNEDADLAYKRRVQDIVGSRREADKVAPLIRWARKITQGLSEEEKMPFVSSMMPDTTIGCHAVDHVDRSFRYPRWSWKRAQDEDWAKVMKVRREKIRSQIVKVLELPGGHRALNKSINHSTTTWFLLTEGGFILEMKFGPTKPPKLGGFGDIDRFLDLLFSCYRAPDVKVEDIHKYVAKTMRIPPRVMFLRNPECHPEWLDSLEVHLDLYLSA